MLGDQLSRDLSALRDVRPGSDVVLMCEVFEEARYVRHHKQKLVFVFSAMRHFAGALRAEGIEVDYVRLDDAGNSGSLSGELQRAVARHGATEVIMTSASEWRVLALQQQWAQSKNCSAQLREDDRFLCSASEFSQWARGRRQLRMESFYRQLRRRTGWLMNGASPAGGRWNFDSENRKRLPDRLEMPAPPTFAPDSMTLDVIELVRRNFASHFGDLEPFRWAVTRSDALRALAEFVARALPNFGDYQDAMRRDADFLCHSVLSPYLNVGLLGAREVCEAALAAWREGQAPLNATEGFIRQVAGWREFVRGIYWLFMPHYAESNHLEQTRPLPALYWGAATQMECLAQCVRNTRQHAYAHHIQRLMVLGNFALLTGVEPRRVEEWYLLVYADAFEWVELPNTHGMALYADGGVLASKPYVASGAYINRMSDYCRHCHFNVRQRTGEAACPFNFLYWNFLLTHREKLHRNPRLAMPYRNLARFGKDELRTIRKEAMRFLADLAREDA